MSEANASPAATKTHGANSEKNPKGTIASQSTSITKPVHSASTKSPSPAPSTSGSSSNTSSNASSSSGSSSNATSGIPSQIQNASQSSIKEKLENNNGIAAALARSLTRGVAIYFSRPVRLFRPSKGMFA
jgi:cellulose 1,4-beta-cellobiosidase